MSKKKKKDIIGENFGETAPKDPEEEETSGGSFALRQGDPRNQVNDDQETRQEADEDDESGDSDEFVNHATRNLSSKARKVVFAKILKKQKAEVGEERIEDAEECDPKDGGQSY